MRGMVVFAVFFIIFLVSALLISSSLFPGNLVPYLLGISDTGSVSALSAFVNGVFYGFLVWVVFSLTFRWVEQSLAKSKLAEKKKQSSKE